MQTRVKGDIPNDIHMSLVTSLFGNRRTLFISQSLQVLCYFLVYAQSEISFYLYLSLTFLAVMLLRAATFAYFHLRLGGQLAPEQVSTWERLYIVGAVTSTALMGIAAAHAIYVARVPFVELVCVSVAMVSMASIIGRNFGSRSAVILQSLSICLPLLAATLARQEYYWALLGLLLVALAGATLRMASGARAVLLRNVEASHEVTVLADSFEAALNNMTHGLVMLDADRRIRVVNPRASSLLRLSAHYPLEGEDLGVVLRYAARRVAVDKRLPELVQQQLAQLIAGEIPRAVLHFSDDLVLEFSANRQAEGGVVLIFEDVTARVASERKILQMIRFDGMTGLPNRTYFAELVKQRLAHGVDGSEVGFLLLDIDDFRHVNDLKGHATGDKLLAVVGKQLRSLVGAADIVLGHLLGDRFVLFFAGAPRAGGIEQGMRDFHALTSGQYDVDGSSFRVGMSAGAVILPAGADVVDGWQIKADLALYEAKSRGKGEFAIFAEELNERYLERQKLKSDLRDAVENRNLSVVYQPMYRPDGSALACCEALSRWTHVEKGPISPAVFIEIAEEIGIVTDITRLIIERACADCADWPASINVSVNLSEHDLRSNNIVTTVRKALEKSGLAPSRLHLEVTESSLIEELSAVSAILQELRDLGIRIAIDDFGTGYSSLSYLDRLPLDIVKIDRSFVRDITGDARRLKLLRGIVNLARKLELEIVVEGVETEAQLALVNEHECADLVQGYIFSRPVAASGIAALHGGPRSRTEPVEVAVA